MNKIISIIIVIVTLVNFAISPLSYAITSGVTINVNLNEGGAQSYSFNDIDYSGKKVDELRDSPTEILKVSTTGYYEISFTHNSQREQFEIVDNNGNILNLAAFQITDEDPRIVYSLGSLGGTDYTRGSVLVKLEAGKTYYLIGYYEPSETVGVATYNVRRVQVPTDYVEIDTGVLSSEYSAPYIGVESAYNSRTKAVANRGAKYSRPGNTVNASGDVIPNRLYYSGLPERYDPRTGSAEKHHDFIQGVIVWLFIHGVADPFRALISGLFGEVTIDDVLFNDFPTTKLSFYKETGQGGSDRNTFLESSTAEGSTTILKMINEFYNLFRLIAIVIYIGMFIFIAIKIILASTGQEKEKYKSMIMDWIKGVALLFFIPYVIKYTIITNEALVALMRAELVDGNENINAAKKASPRLQSMSGTFKQALGHNDKKYESEDLMMKYRSEALEEGSIVKGLIYIFLLVQLLGIVLQYFRRLLSIMLLIVVFPFVAVTYAVDKIKDGQPQIYQSWLKEFLLNVFMQFFQAIVYIAVMYLVGALMEGGTTGANLLMVVIAIKYITKSESLLRALFPSLMSGGGVGTVKPLESEVTAMTNTTLIKRAKGNMLALGNRVKNMNDRTGEFIDKAQSYREEANKKNADWRAKRNYDEQVSRVMTDGHFEDSLQRIGDIPVGLSNADRAEAEETRKAKLDRKAQALDDLNFARHSDDDEIRRRYEEFMASRSADERERLEKQMDAKESLNEVLTGKDRSGKQLSAIQLAIRAKVVMDVVRSSEGQVGTPDYKDIREWMAGKTIGVEETLYDGGKLTADEGKRRLEQGRQVRVKTATRQVALLDYLDADKEKEFITETERGKTTTLHKGQGLAGLFVTEATAETLEEAQRMFGGANGGIQTISSDRLVTRFDEDTGRTVLVGYLDEFGSLVEDPDALRVRKERGEETIDISFDEMEELRREQEEEIAELAERFYKESDGEKASKEERAEIDEAAGLVFELVKYMERINDPSNSGLGMDASEAYRISSRLNALASRNEFVASLISQTLYAAPTPPIFRDEEEDIIKQFQVDMHGISLSWMEAMSAEGVIRTNGSLSDRNRKLYTQAAVKSLSRDTVDSVIASIAGRSENDDILGDNPITEIEKDGKIKRDGKSQEQILEEKFEEEIKEETERITSNRIAERRAEMFGSAVRAAGATASAVVGIPFNIAVSGTTAALTAGGSDEPELSGILTGWEAGSRLENFAETVVPGTTSAGNSGTIGSMIGNAPDRLGGSNSSSSSEREKRHRRSAERDADSNDPYVRQAVRNSAQASRSAEIRNRLS